MNCKISSFFSDRVYLPTTKTNKEVFLVVFKSDLPIRQHIARLRMNEIFIGFPN